MAARVKLIQLNIEHAKHLDVIHPFLEREHPDLVCLQEVDEDAVAGFEKTIGAESFFVPMSRYLHHGPAGIAVFSRLPIRERRAFWYGGSMEEMPVYDDASFESKHASHRFSLAVCDIENEHATFRVGTTHFPVSGRGEATDFQREDIERLLAILKEQGDIVFTGDFNAPRGGEIFSKLASAYKDNVPPQYKTSIDIVRHRNGKDRPHELADKMVDGIFSTPGYTVTNVKLQDGVSDHCAIVATIEKR
jgi:endonuclease/exonuclease/phosphatase family metal-dependent hydrolase